MLWSYNREKTLNKSKTIPEPEFSSMKGKIYICWNTPAEVFKKLKFITWIICPKQWAPLLLVKINDDSMNLLEKLIFIKVL